jgi:hypothetical protein
LIAEWPAPASTGAASGARLSGGGGAGGEEGDDGDVDQALIDAVLKASLDTPQPAMDDEVILHLSLSYIHVLQVSL